VGAPTTDVKERDQISIAVDDLVVRPASTTLELDSAGVRASGQRSTATCSATGDLEITYVAGENSPWRDFCIVPVRYAGQEWWTHLTIAIRVIPGNPQPELRSASLEVSPGAELVYDLGSMTTWQGDAQSDALYSVGGANGSFEIVSDASTQSLTIRGLDAAVPGTVEAASIGITNPQYDGVLPAGLTLRVGPAPSTLPKGGTVTQECSVSQNGAQCSINVIGVAGEVNPLPGTPLLLVSVAQPAACPTVNFSQGGPATVVATWTQETPGAVCAATFSVRDAQTRESASDRVGTVILDFQGLPASAASVSQIGYGDARATLTVVPGAASSSYPALTGFEIVRGGTLVSTCTVQGACEEIVDLENGAEFVYEAFALNAQGRALTAPSVTAWAYRAPTAPAEASAIPTVPRNNEQENWPGLKADVQVSGISDDVARLELRLSDGTLITQVDTQGDSSVALEGVAVGSNSQISLTITAISKFRVPDGASPTGGSLVLSGVHGIGAPTVAAPQVLFAGVAGARTATVSGSAIANGAGSTVELAILQGPNNGAVPSCPSATSSEWGAATSRMFAVSNADSRRTIAYVVCARSVRGDETYGVTSAAVSERFFLDPGAPGGSAVYTVSEPSVSLNTTDGTQTIDWSITPPALTSPDGDFQVEYTIGGSPTFDFALPIGTDPGVITARLCEPGPDGQCSPSFVTVTASGPLDRPAQVSIASCVVDSAANPVTGYSGAGIEVSSSGVLATSGTAVDYSVTVSVAGRTSFANVAVNLCPPPAAPEPPTTP